MKTALLTGGWLGSWRRTLWKRSGGTRTALIAGNRSCSSRRPRWKRVQGLESTHTSECRPCGWRRLRKRTMFSAMASSCQWVRAEKLRIILDSGNRSFG